jgi:AcrR family transcriptional regulator
VSKESPRDRLAQAAFALFDERGYEQATIDDITERAGVGRTTFFRHYRSKEDVIFPDHDLLLAQIGERLRTSSNSTALLAVSDAVRLVLKHYVAEGDLARRRYTLTSGAGVETPRDRHRGALPAAVPRVHRRPDGDPAESTPLRAELGRPWSPPTITCSAAGCAARARTRSASSTTRCAR